jgi:hypothetical protein
MNTITQNAPTVQATVNNSLKVLNTFDTTLLNTTPTDISQTKLVEILRELNPTSGMVSLFYYGDFSASRTRQGKKALKKLSYQRIFIGHNYQNKVNARLKNEAEKNGLDVETFISKKASGLDKISNVLYINKKDQFRLRGYLGHEKNGSTEMVSVAKSLGYYTPNDVSIDFESAKENDLFAPSFFSKKTYTSGRNSLIENENNFQVRNFSIENILGIAIGGKVFRVI